MDKIAEAKNGVFYAPPNHSGVAIDAKRNLKHVMLASFRNWGYASFFVDFSVDKSCETNLLLVT
jgi:hypothetical protein